MPSRFTLVPAAPFRLDLTAWALRRRPMNVVDRWDGDAYRRALPVNGTVVAVEVRQSGPPDAAHLDVAVTTNETTTPEHTQAGVTAALNRMLGLDVGLDEFYRRAQSDPHLGPLAARYRGLKPPRFPTVFECLVNAIACQQLTLTVGITVLNRLAEAFGPTGPGRVGDEAHAFPDAADFAAGVPADLRALGLSTRKAEYVLELAGRVATGELDLEALAGQDDEVALASLQQLRGVGRWSAEYALLRGLGRIDVFPGDDVGARNNLQRQMGITTVLDYAGVRRAVAPWDPYAGFGYFHLLMERIDEAGWLDDAP